MFTSSLFVGDVTPDNRMFPERSAKNVAVETVSPLYSVIFTMSIY